MKYSIVFLILLTIFGEPALKRTPRIKEIPKREYGGKVKRIIEYQCDKYWRDENSFKIVKNSCKIYNIKEFNLDEILIRSRSWNNFDYLKEPDLTEIQKINKSGLVIEKIKFSSTGETKENYSYNPAGFETEHVLYINGMLFSRYEIFYDEYNCPIKEIYYNDNNEIKYYYTNEFDDKNREILSKRYNKDNSLEGKWTKEYEKDSDDWIIKCSFSSDGKLLEREDKRELYKSNKFEFVYTSDLPDKGFTDVEYYSNGKVKTWHYINYKNEDIYQTYDLNGRIIERKIYHQEDWQYSYTWKYREDGAVIEESESTSRVIGKKYYKRTTYYSVDFNGNWIEKYTIDIDGNSNVLRVREIEYY
ncbi:MAG: hypothetical protein RBT15_09925 [Gudongella sp.]|jgi:hypothetical protein|nr:hypothetical protein [Gudongella sp.]